MRQPRKGFLPLLAAAVLLFSLPPAVSAAATDAGEIAIDESHFPDKTFCSYVSTEFDTDGSGSLSSDEIANAVVVYVNDSGIKTLKGIEYLSALSELYCYGNQLTSLDVSGNPQLSHLDCSNNQLTSLNVRDNYALEVLQCSDNRLVTLDLQDLLRLREVYCNNNQLVWINSISAGNGESVGAYCESIGNIYSLGEVGETYWPGGLNQLVGGEESETWDPEAKFDMSKVEHLSGAVYDESTGLLHGFKDGGGTFTYKYRTGFSAGSEVVFTLAYTHHIPDTAVSIDSEHFPDDAFRAYICSEKDSDQNGYLSATEIAETDCILTTGFSCGNIYSLEGIEYFTALQWITIKDARITSVDLSRNTSLIENLSTFSDIEYDIGEVGDSYKLTNLPGKFDGSKTSNWSGAAYDAQTNSICGFANGTGRVSYDYATGNDACPTVTFTLTYTHHSAVEIAPVLPDGYAALGISVGTDTVQNDDGSTALAIAVTESATGEAPAQPYVHLVRWCGADGTYTTVRKSEDGTFLIPAEAQSVSVESAMLGDVMADSYIDNKDLILLRRGVADTNVFSDLQTLTADLYSDGEINNKDLITIRRQIA